MTSEEEEELAEANAEADYWKDQFEQVLADYQKANPHKGYKYTGGRAGSPRERARVAMAIRAYFG
jgi:hypothetical protein